MIRKLVLATAVASATVALCATPVAAHPLGNFTINTAHALTVAPEGVTIDVAIDVAEIPTLQARPQIDVDGDDALGAGERDAYRDRECRKVQAAATLTVDSTVQPLTGSGRDLVIVDGLAGLSTMRITCTLRAPLALRDGTHTISFATSYADGHVGWHEISAQGDGVVLDASSVPATSPSAMLTSYPQGSLSSPPDVRRVELRGHPGGARLDTGELAAGAAPNAANLPTVHASSVPGVDRATRSFAGLVASHDLTVRIGLLAVLVAFVLGVFHAIAPGHGKTVMAAYLVGERGTLRQALGVGATVTFTHTAGVLALGLLISVSTVASPDRLYPWLGALSGLMLASIGLGLLRRARRLRRAGLPVAWHQHGAGGHDHHAHDHHAHDHHAHDHHAHDHHAHDHHGDTGPAAGAMSWRWIVAMGFAGGMVPSPSALVVLLGAVALGRTWFGVALVLAYGIGMAATLVAAGLLLVRARVRIERAVTSDRGQRVTRVLAVMPVITALVIVAGGLMVTARAARIM